MSGFAYELCPCSSGEKVKFCCCKDIPHDLQKVVDSLEGGQRVSALSQLNRLLESKGNRAALLGLKAGLQADMDETEAFTETATKLLELYPSNPLALGFGAILAAFADDVDVAVERLHRAFAASYAHLDVHVYSAFSIVSLSLLKAGRVQAARAHLSIQMALSGNKDQYVARLMEKVMSAPSSLLERDARHFEDCPEDASWKSRFDEAVHDAKAGFWLRSWERFTRLDHEFPQEPSILRNLATIRCWLGDLDGAVEALHAFAALPSVPLEDAACEEALALELAKNDKLFESVRIPVELMDGAAAQEKLLCDKRFFLMAEGDRSDEDPPPKASFLLLDRPPLADGIPATFENSPRARAMVWLWGKETDRPARLEFGCIARHVTEVSDELRAVLGELLGKAHEPVSAGVHEAVDYSVGFGCFARGDSGIAFSAESVEEGVNTVWGTLPFTSLDGKSPLEVANDPAYRVRLLAEVLRVECDSLRKTAVQLRNSLGLPQPQTTVFNDSNMSKLSVLTLANGDFTGASDQALVSAYLASVRSRAIAALRRVSEEILRRPSLANLYPDVHYTLAGTDPTAKDALEHIQTAVRLVPAGMSPANYLLVELEIQAKLENMEAVVALIERLQKHRDEPGVLDALVGFLYSIGAIRPGQEGDPAMANAGEPLQQDASPEPISAGGVWTPGAPAQPAAGKSKLWLPT